MKKKERQKNVKIHILTYQNNASVKSLYEVQCIILQYVKESESERCVLVGES